MCQEDTGHHIYCCLGCSSHLLGSCWNTIPGGLPRRRHPQDTSNGVFVTMGKRFCFPTRGSINSTNEQNFVVWLIVSSREPPSHTRQMFFLQIRGSLEDVSQPGAWRNEAPGWVCGWGRALLLTSGPCLLGGSTLRFLWGLEIVVALHPRLTVEGLEASCLTYRTCPERVKRFNRELTGGAAPGPWAWVLRNFLGMVSTSVPFCLQSKSQGSTLP